VELHPSEEIARARLARIDDCCGPGCTGDHAVVFLADGLTWTNRYRDGYTALIADLRIGPEPQLP
jgi:hypothetical protein